MWFGLNLLFGLGSVSLVTGDNQSVAWEAHVGGFLAGLLLFSLFDPVQPPPIAEDDALFELGGVNRLSHGCPVMRLTGTGTLTHLAG